MSSPNAALSGTCPARTTSERYWNGWAGRSRRGHSEGGRSVSLQSPTWFPDPIVITAGTGNISPTTRRTDAPSYRGCSDWGTCGSWPASRYSNLLRHMPIFVYPLQELFRIEFFGHVMPCRTVARAFAVVVIGAMQKVGGKQHDRTGGNDQVHCLRFIDFRPAAMPQKLFL